MKKTKNVPDYIFEISWEVCNLVGGIYTVLSTKAKTLHEMFGNNLIFIGPDIWKKSESPYFIESEDLLKDWQRKARSEGIDMRIGHWDIPGSPIVVLVDFEKYYADKDSLYANMWNWFNVDSLHAYGDYDEASMFAYASALVVESFYNYHHSKKQILVNFNEWTTGMGLLYVKKKLPDVATVFTTHATAIGRSIAGNNKPLYDYLQFYNGDQMAMELNMQSKHSVEKTAANNAGCFTTVSDITAREATQLLERTPIVTPNGFEENFVPRAPIFDKKREQARKQLLNVASKLIGYTPSEDTVLIATAGRHEYKNKGLDLLLDSISELRYKNPQKDVIVYILVPGWVAEPRFDLVRQLTSISDNMQALPDPVITHTLYNPHEDAILGRIHSLGFGNQPGDKVKIIYVPCYLKGDDGIFNETYYNLLIGMDATIFPSYYEPWGYTPLESIAFGVPTITTDLAGFGLWCLDEDAGIGLSTGVKVVHRNDNNYHDVVNIISDNIMELVAMDPSSFAIARSNAKALAHKARWKYFIKYYKDAYSLAIEKIKEKNL